MRFVTLTQMTSGVGVGKPAPWEDGGDVAVNPAHVVAVFPRKGGVTKLKLTDGLEFTVKGELASVTAALAGEPYNTD